MHVVGAAAIVVDMGVLLLLLLLLLLLWVDDASGRGLSPPAASQKQTERGKKTETPDAVAALRCTLLNPKP